MCVRHLSPVVVLHLPTVGLILCAPVMSRDALPRSPPIPALLGCDATITSTETRAVGGHVNRVPGPWDELRRCSVSKAINGHSMLVWGQSPPNPPLGLPHQQSGPVNSDKKH